jgi:hypothetical protein
LKIPYRGVDLSERDLHFSSLATIGFRRVAATKCGRSRKDGGMPNLSKLACFDVMDDRKSFVAAKGHARLEAVKESCFFVA